MSDHLVLVLNAGSSSLKWQVLRLPAGTREAGGHVERLDGSGFGAALGEVMTELTEAGLAEGLTAVGHRVVHGGLRHTAPVLIDDDLLASIDDLARLAPLHNPPAAEGIRAARSAFPDLPQVAVFDTAFFADLPAAAATYALDRDLLAREEVRRYGMHGTSHRYVAGVAAELLGRPADEVDLVVLHLGNGASASAVRGGRPVDTSMGLTPLEGLVMGTRGGDLDPGVLLHLLRHGGLDLPALEDLLHHRGGLAGLIGSGDFRDLVAGLDAGDEAAALAYEVYRLRIRKYVGAYLTLLDHPDAVVFTAGVGEHQPRLREDVLAGLDHLGLRVDPARNRADASGPRRVSPDDSPVAVLVVPTDEELAIARDVVSLLGG